MSVSGKFGLLILAAVVGLGLVTFDLVGDGPHDRAAVALRQFDGAAAADELRLAEAAKNWWAVIIPAGLALLAGLLFWDDVEGWVNKQSPKPQDERSESWGSPPP